MPINLILLNKIAGKVLNPIMSYLFPKWWKERNELAYWKMKKREEKTLSNLHYEFFYTTHFGIDKSTYNNKVLLDLGCGPRGSLEWAKNAKRRIGLDPLSAQYLKWGADKHEMEYMTYGSEHIPLEDGECDVIFSFNSLDHVEDVFATVNEIKRCLSPTGFFLLLVEVNHLPTACEPHTLTPKGILALFNPEFEAQLVKVYKPKANGMYQSIKLGDTYSNALNCQEVGWFSAKFVRK